MEKAPGRVFQTEGTACAKPQKREARTCCVFGTGRSPVWLEGFVGERKWCKKVQGWIVGALLASQESECPSECNRVAD